MYLQRKDISYKTCCAQASLPMLVMSIYAKNVECKVASSLMNWGLDAMTTLFRPLYYKGYSFYCLLQSREIQ